MTAIEKALAKLSPGDRVALTFNDGGTVLKVEGVVDENDGSESLALLEDNDEMLFITYLSVATFRKLKSTSKSGEPSVKVVPAPPVESISVSSVPQEEVPHKPVSPPPVEAVVKTPDFMPEITLSVNPKELEKLYNALRNEIKDNIKFQFRDVLSYQASKKNGDRFRAIQQVAAIEKLITSDERFSDDKKANIFVGYLNVFVGLYNPVSFRKAHEYSLAAISSYLFDNNNFKEIAPLALISLVSSQQNTEAMLGLLCVASVTLYDFSAFELLIQTDYWNGLSEDLQQKVFEYLYMNCGKTFDLMISAQKMLDTLLDSYPDHKVINSAMKIYSEDTGDNLLLQNKVTDRMTGVIGRVSWSSETAYITASDGQEYSFLYKDVRSDAKFFKQLSSLRKRDVNPPIPVEFELFQNRPLHITRQQINATGATGAGRSPLQAGRLLNASKLPDRFARSVAFFLEALKTPDRTEAFRELINDYVALAKNEGSQEYLQKAYDLYVEMKAELPEKYKYHKPVFDLLIKLQYVDEAIDLFEKMYLFTDCSILSTLADCYSLALFLCNYGREQSASQRLRQSIHYFDLWKNLYDKNKTLPEIASNPSYEMNKNQMIPYKCAMCYEALGEYQKAMELAQSSIRYAHSDDCLELINRLKESLQPSESEIGWASGTSQPDNVFDGYDEDDRNNKDDVEDEEDVQDDEDDDEDVQDDEDDEDVQDDEDDEDVQDDEDDEDVNAFRYSDPGGLPELGLTENEIIEYAIDLCRREKLPEMTVYLKAASVLSEKIRWLSDVTAYAVNSPLNNVSYNANEVIERLSGEIDKSYLDFVSLACYAVYLRSVFADTDEQDTGAIFAIKGLADSVKVPESLSLLFNALFSFKKQTGYGMEYFVSERDNNQQGQLLAAVFRAEDVRSRLFTGDVQDKSPRSVRVTREIIFKPAGLLGKLIHFTAENDIDSAQNLIPAFREALIKRGMPISADNVDNEKIDQMIENAWGEARERTRASASDTVYGARRNNLINRIRETAAAIANWIEACAHSRESSQINECRALYQSGKKQVQDLIRSVVDEMPESEDNPHLAAGYQLIMNAVTEVEYKLDGIWDENRQTYFFADFLRTGQVLLDENYLPDLSSTFFSLRDFNILARIRAHVEDSETTLPNRFNQIFSSGQETSDMGTARLISAYAEAVCLPEELPLPDEMDQFVKAASLRTENAFRRFMQDYAMSVSRGQIFVSDSFMNVLSETVEYWYQTCVCSENFGFFFRLIQKCREEIRNNAVRYENELRYKLSELILSCADFFQAEPAAADDIGRLIAEQNFIVAEDRMNRIKRQDYSGSGNLEENSISTLEKFCNGYDEIYSLLRDNSININMLFRSVTVKIDRNTSGSQALIDNWFSGSSSLTAENIQNLLIRLDWPKNIQVERITFDRYDVFRVKQDAEHSVPQILRHPIAVFGSQMSEKDIFVVCIPAERTVSQLCDIFKEIDLLTGSKIVLYAHALKLVERRELAKQLKQHPLSNTHILIDRVMIYYLAQNYVEGETGRMMLQLTMPFTYYQPYVVDSSQPLPPEMFIGREKELRSIKSIEGASLVYGGRQLGKSALLRKAGIDVNAKTDGSRAVIADIKDRNIRQAAQRASQELADNGIISTVTDDWEELSSCLISRLRCTGGERPIPYLLLMLDEADVFLDCCREVNYLPINALKNVQTSCPGKFKFVLAGLHNVVRFNREDSLSGNSVIPHFTSSEINIRPFTHEEGMELMKYPLSFLGFSFGCDSVLIDHILATTNYFPGLIQLYCKKLLESMTSGPYAGYDSMVSPPYRITGEHIGRIISDKSFVSQIKEKFEITLELDASFYAIALLMALLYDKADAQNRDIGRGFTVEDVLSIAEEECYWNIYEMEPSMLRAWMLDLCDLNILTNTDDDHFLFSTKSFRDMLGSRKNIIEKLNCLI